jgi:hypothetical protein
VVPHHSEDEIVDSGEVAAIQFRKGVSVSLRRLEGEIVIRRVGMRDHELSSANLGYAARACGQIYT